MNRGAYRRKLILVFLLGMLASAAFFVLYFNVLEKGDRPSAEKLEYYRDLDSRFGKYYTIENMLRSKSLYDISDENMDREIANAVLGIVDDKYAQYYTQAEYEEFQRQYLGSYSGVGVAAGVNEDGNVYVIRLIEGGPAEEAGLEPGDVIAEIDGTVPESLEQASEMLRGETGTKVTVKVIRGSEELMFNIYRAEVEEKSVSYDRMFPDDGIGYIQIISFRDGTAGDFEQAVKNLKSDGYDKIIIDVRGNTGGVAKDAVEIADMLLPACTIITVRNKEGKESVENSDGTTVGIKYVLLVDESSASASEILAGAVKDNGGGPVIGSKTFGKGVIQSIYKLEDGSALKFTTEEYILPSGNSINGTGIEPDIGVKEDEDILDVAREALLD